MAQNIDNKKTTLDDDAEIYHQQQESFEKLKFSERWKKMTREEKKAHFRDYMIKPIIIGIIVAVAIVLGAINLYKNGGTTVFRIASVRSEYIKTDKLEEHLEELKKLWDLGKRQKVVLDAAVGSFTGNAGTAMASQLDNLIYSGKLEAFIGTEEDVAICAGYCRNLEVFIADFYDQIPAESLKSMEFANPNPDSDGEMLSYVCAVKMSDTVLADCIADNVKGKGELYIMFPEGGMKDKNAERVQEFIKYLFGI